MKNELVSIIVPIYKVEKYINQCIESIINQTYKNIEIILVDDGSPDNCGKICDEYAKKDKRIIVIHQKNGGLSAARNAGLDICKGEYISFIDSDDYVSSEFINSLHEACINNNAEIAQCNYFEFEDYVNEPEILSSCNNDISINTNRDMLIKLFNKDYCKYVIACNKLYKRNIYDSIRFPIGKINEDMFTTHIAFSRSCNIVCLNKPYYFYRINQSSIMRSTYNEKRLDVLDGAEERKKFFKDDIEMYPLVIEQYQLLLKESFFKTKKYIKDNKKILPRLRKKIKENFKDIKKVSKKNVFKEYIFAYFPDIYFYFAMIKDRLNYK